MTSNQIIHTVLGLSEHERAEVATVLIDSLDSGYVDEDELLAEGLRRERTAADGTARYLDESEFLAGIQRG